MMASNQNDDLDILRGIIENDEDSWRLFYAKFDKIIYRCITKVTAKFPQLNAYDVEEIYSNFHVQLLQSDRRRLRSYDPSKGCHLGSWVGLIAVQVTYNYLREIQRRPLPATLGDSLPETENADVSPLDQAALREEVRLLYQQMLRLSERDRRFINLYFIEERNAVEVARAMGISVKTVYTKKHKIRAKLEELCASFRAREEMNFLLHLELGEV